MSIDLYELADNVETEQDFLSFVQALMEDKESENKKEKVKPSSPYGTGANGWENGNIVTFLDAALSLGTSLNKRFRVLQKARKPLEKSGPYITCR